MRTREVHQFGIGYRRPPLDPNDLVINRHGVDGRRRFLLGCELLPSPRPEGDPNRAGSTRGWSGLDLLAVKRGLIGKR
jgi:hypothetical protein